MLRSERWEPLIAGIAPFGRLSELEALRDPLRRLSDEMEGGVGELPSFDIGCLDRKKITDWSAKPTAGNDRIDSEMSWR